MAKFQVKVTALPEKGFRRAGFSFTREPSEVTIDGLQLKVLQEEPLLSVQVLKEIPDENENVAPTKPPKAEDLIAQIKVAATEKDVDTILGTDQRKTVVEAAVVRKAELAG
jgi:hypothetical protein